MSGKFDIAAYSKTRQLVLLAEIHSLRESSEDAAVQFRMNLLTHNFLGEVPYFLIADRNSLFLWKQGSEPGKRPDFKSPAKPVLKKYLGNLADTNDRIGAESLDQAIRLWLTDLATEYEPPNPDSEADKMLVQSGLLACLKGGEIRRLLPE